MDGKSGKNTEARETENTGIGNKNKRVPFLFHAV